MAEDIYSDYIWHNPALLDDFRERVAAYTMAQAIADEVVCIEVIFE